uniref:Uncharacterized protein n=1 Tax=viral metagenome TaxID=1070528 RepID=A0A6C0H4Z5_9ZZZZ
MSKSIFSIYLFTDFIILIYSLFFIYLFIYIIMENIFLQKLGDLIQNKKKFLLSKINDIKSKYDSNNYLESVHNDYQNYKNTIVNDKTELLNAFKKIDTYLDSILLSKKLNSYEITKIQNEKNNILNIISLLQSEINDLS